MRASPTSSLSSVYYICNENENNLNESTSYTTVDEVYRKYKKMQGNIGKIRKSLFLLFLFQYTKRKRTARKVNKFKYRK